MHFIFAKGDVLRHILYLKHTRHNILKPIHRRDNPRNSLYFGLMDRVQSDRQAAVRPPDQNMDKVKNLASGTFGTIGQVSNFVFAQDQDCIIGSPPHLLT